MVNKHYWVEVFLNDKWSLTIGRYDGSPNDWSIVGSDYVFDNDEIRIVCEITSPIVHKATNPNCQHPIEHRVNCSYGHTQCMVCSKVSFQF